MKLHTIETGYFKLDGGAMYGVVPKSIWHKLNPPDANNMCNWAMRCLLVEDGNSLTLIDTGIGTKQSDKFFGHYYLNGNHTLQNSLQQLGFSTNDITDVLLTHLHFDHCGGAIQLQGEQLVPTFANATYWSNQSHWQWAIQPNDREKASFLTDNILPIQQSGQLKFVENNTTQTITDTTAFNPYIQIAYANGHTDSMMIPLVQYKGYTIAYMADLLPSVSHLPLPYIISYDMFPLQTLTEKKQFLQHAQANNYLLYFEHDPTNELCSLQLNEKGNVVVGEILTLQDL